MRHKRLDEGAHLSQFTYTALSSTYLFASYAYYELDNPILNDHTFDRICKHLYDDFDVLKGEGVRGLGELITEGNLQAGTCLGVCYPEAVMQIVRELIQWKQAEDLDI